MSKTNISIIGSGAYGTSMANLLVQNKDNKITIYGIDAKEVEDINQNKRNSKYFGDLPLDKKLTATTDIWTAIKDVDVIMLATPSDFVIKVVEDLVSKLDHAVTWINLAKGFDYVNKKLISVELEKIIPTHLDKGICKVSGPTYAIELITREPSSFTIGCVSQMTSEMLQETVFDVKRVVTESTNDIVGVEFSSVIKNSLAIFMGVLAGMDMQKNTTAMFLVLAIKEMQSFKRRYPSMKNATLLGFAGLGDLYLTGTSEKSRNYLTGFEIGKTNMVDPEKWQNTTIEGIRSIDTLVEIADKNKIKLLLLPMLKKIFDGKTEPKDGIEKLIQKLRERNIKL